MSLKERALLERAAAGMSLGAYVRLKVFGTPPPHRSLKPHDWEVEAARGLAEFAKTNIPNNLNQVARAMNTGSFPATPETHHALNLLIAEIREITCEIVERLHQRRRSP